MAVHVAAVNATTLCGTSGKQDEGESSLQAIALLRHAFDVQDAIDSAPFQIL